MAPSSSDAEPTLRGDSAGARVFGRYTLVSILGRGGMGVVWRARDEVLGEEVALKFLPDAVRWDPGAYEDLKEETRRARQLTHPNIVRIHDFVEDASSAAISMELVEGSTLTALRLAQADKVLAPAEIARWLPQLCAALDYAHGEARVIHRDLKPTNLMLTHDGRLKVADFGVARSMADSITRVSMMSAGTLVYMSPQQAMGEEPSPADDLYALGATLYELLTGKPPFHTGDVRMQLFQRRPESIAARRKSLGVAGGAVPPAWEDAIAACLAKEAAERPVSAGELLCRLNPTKPVRRPWLRPLTRRELGLGAVGLAVLGAAVVGAFRTVSVGRSSLPTAFPSDATRALAAWNFDGDARDASGRGLDGTVADAVPTADRFGRLDRALRFNGYATVTIPDAPVFRWGGADTFTAALWVRSDETAETSGDFFRCDTAKVSAFEWALGSGHGRPTGTIREGNSEIALVLSSPEVVPFGVWHHLALVNDGIRATLFVNGRPVDSKPSDRCRTVPPPDQVTLRLGRPAATAGWGFYGTLDEVRLWRRALAPQEIAALVVNVAPPRIAITRAHYRESDDFGTALREEFGEEARLLDWTDIKRMHADDARGWVAEMGLVVNDTGGILQCGGRRIFADKRQYFISRFDGTKPDYYMVHEEIGGMTVALGSWDVVHSPLLASMPAPKIATEVFKAESGGSVIRCARAFGVDRTAMALTWRARLRSAGDTGVRARLRLANGHEVRAVCEPGGDASLALALGDAEDGGISRMITAKYGEFEFTLVARDRRLAFRAVGTVGRNPLFSETTGAAGFRLADVVALEITGGPQSGLAAATLVVE